MRHKVGCGRIGGGPGPIYDRAEEELVSLQAIRKEREQAQARIAAAEEAMNAQSPVFTYRSNPGNRLRFSNLPGSPFSITATDCSDENDADLLTQTPNQTTKIGRMPLSLMKQLAR